MSDRLDYPVGDLQHGALVQVSRAAKPLPVNAPDVKCDRFESVTVSTSSVGLTAALAREADVAFITSESAVVRFRLDGIAPTASVGHELQIADLLELRGQHEILNARFIRRDATDATLRVSYGTEMPE